MALITPPSQSDGPPVLTFNAGGGVIKLFPVMPLSWVSVLYDVDGLSGVRSLVLPETSVDGNPIVARCRDGIERHGTWAGDLQRSMDAFLEAHPSLRYRTENYTRTEGLSLDDLTGHLRQVHREYPEYHDLDHGSGRFEDMVERFARDPFYKLHHVAIAYLSAVASTLAQGNALDEAASDPVPVTSPSRPRPR